MANDSEKTTPFTVDDVLRRRIPRRTVLGGAAAAAAGVLGAGMLGGGAVAAPVAGHGGTLAPNQDATPEAPADAAAPENSVFVMYGDPAQSKVIDFYESVYERPGVADLFSEPLVRLDRNFQIQPAAAESWSGSEDGKTWTFKIRQGMTWSDGNPVTANDYVKTLQYAADPSHAWDFTWYFQGVIKGWNAVVAPAEGTPAATPDSIGVHTGADDYELVVETEVPAPYLPAMLLYSWPLSKAALESSGPLYNTNPETAVSSGPFILTEWTPDQQIVYSKNDKYSGTLNVPVNKVICKLATADNYFTMYQNNELDYVQQPPPASVKVMQADPTTAKEVYSGVADFPTYHIFFDVTKAPFDNLKVRQAWSHVIDRDAIVQQILGPAGKPAYSWLAPGFPASNSEGLKDIQKFDPELGKQLLADAGYPDGKDFPKQELWVRDSTPEDKAVSAACAAMVKQYLNIDVEVVQKQPQEYMAALTAKPTQILLGWVRYGMDFFDPANMLGVWHSGGRYSWSNPDYDAKLDAASQFLGDPNERIKMFQDAERILVEDVPAVFVYHGTYVQFIKPWVTGQFLQPDDNGIIAMHWPNYTTASTVPQELYIRNDAPSRG
jgi:ABC-type transport system substrate-binding protein